MSTSAILDPASPADVERYAGPVFPAYGSQVDAAAYLDSMGNHLEAAAGRAIHGARWAQHVSICKRIEFDDAVAKWEASPDSSTRGALNAAVLDAGHPCDGCDKPSCPCADVPQ